MKNYLHHFCKSFLTLVLFSQLAHGQLSSFTLTVTATNETCLGNGILNFSVSNTTPGATILYSIYHLPNTTTPIAVVATNSMSGLNADSYSVVASQSLGSLSNTQQQTITITSSITPLTYQITGQNEICGNDGKITVNVTTGNAVQYEIFQGPIIRPLQTSNIFSGLVAGQYSVRVFDNCGEAVVQTYEVIYGTAGLSIYSNSYISVSCDYSIAQISIMNTPNNLIHYPLTITITVFPPNGEPPIVYNQVVNSGSETTNAILQNITLYPNQSYTYNIHIVDGCGNIYENNGNTVASNTVPFVTQQNASCNGYEILVYNAQSSVLINAPSSFPYNLPYSLQISPMYGTFFIAGAPAGNYTFINTTYCGEQITQSITLDPVGSTINFNSFLGCDNNHGGIFGSSNLQSVIITNAPNNYPNTLPQNVSGNINTQGYFIQNEVPSGLYTILATDVCGNTQSIDFEVLSINDVIDVNIIKNCNSFDINLNYSWNYPFFGVNEVNAFWLQRLNPITNQWENPLTGIVYIPGQHIDSTNAIQLTNNSINYNFSFLGTFRIVKVHDVDVPNGYCVRQIYQFEYTGVPKFNDVYSFACVNGTYDVIVDAAGIAPLIYRIIEKNGLPFVVQNGNSNMFLGINVGHYKFQVEDSCGNIVNSEFDVPRPYGFPITPVGFCNGQPASLTVPNFSFLQYQWYKDNNTSTILSTSNSLQFPSFAIPADLGTYHVRVLYTGNPSSCIDFTLDYQILTATTPNAGQNNSISYCSSQGTINLFNLLLGTYDAGGTWTETTSSGALTNNLWNSTAVANGTYVFKYTVTNACGSSSSANITIALTQSLQIPIASASAVVCSGQSLNLYATAIPNGTYHWSGPNGFSSTQQNPIIPSFTAVNNGVYSVYSVLGSCQSAVSTVNVSVTATTPNAGQNNSVSYCSSQGTINLFTLLSGTYDAGGTWTETTSSGALTNNLWNSTAVANGTYVFNYTVTNACGFSNATVTIAITKLQNPIASTDAILCLGQNLNLYATSVSSGTYQWTGPNGFSSTQQNPVINSATNANDGTYFVKVVLNSCISVVSNVVVAVNSLPDFGITGDCINNIFTLTATPILNSFNVATATYHWTGPNNFSNTNNPVQISGAPTGTYQLTVTNTNGCTATKTIDVVRTICEIPRGVSPDGDGLNDSFNLTGFDVKKIKIFNRYGMLVYEMSDYLNQWHGQDFKGTILPSGTYYYYIELGNNGEAKTGWVYLALTD